MRIVSILLIISMHVIGMAASKGGELSLENTYFRFFIGAIGNLGVSCFVLISGYFGVKFSWKKFVFISLLTTVYACLTAFCNSGFTASRDCIMALTTVPRYFNWYITCYIILMMLSGYLNSFINTLSKQSFQKLLIILFVVMSLLPMFVSATETVQLKSGQCLTYFIYVYFIGRYLKLHHDKSYAAWKCLALVALMVLLMWGKCVLALRLAALDTIPLMSNYSPTVLVAAVATLYFFKSFNFKSRIINYISASVLAVYLLDWMRPTVDRYIQVYQHNQYPDFAIYVFIEVITIFVFALVIDKIRIHIFHKPEEWIENKLVKTCEKTWTLMENRMGVH